MLHLKLKLTLPLVLVFVGILCRSNLEIIFKSLMSFIRETEEKNSIKVFLPDELLEYKGVVKRNLYVAVLGTVFDVTKGKKHYGKDSPYHYFTGKDGSRALVTGDFKDESENRDHTLDLSCDDLLTLVNWRSTFRKKYKYVGVLNGRYFDKYGKKTAYYQDVIKKVEQCKQEKETAKRKELEYPPCNMEWSEDRGTKVWCSLNSGGITRNWVGVPRQYYEPGEDKPRCVCIKDDYNVPAGLLKEYDNCAKTSTTCILPVS
ncbi:neuferricin [Manduca sexta]|uniref:Cytochrome b5 heme-binding domain-containing protein n=1 Tax=Manduca sexta TaxID=7130 RepID=A0A921Z114_MANSE|nr:neuferricin [Manduca sexta]KAG6448337.1 hypothetical protein O3G_MSEX005452 [Manduca sexta]